MNHRRRVGTPLKGGKKGKGFLTASPPLSPGRTFGRRPLSHAVHRRGTRPGSLIALLAAVAVAGLTVSCGPQITPDSARQELQEIYDRQNTGYANANVPEMFFRIRRDAVFTDVDGNRETARRQMHHYAFVLHHGMDFAATTEIKSVTVNANIASVTQKTTSIYTLNNTAYNFIQGKPDSFEDDVVSVDVWRKKDSGWWEMSSQDISDQWLRNGIPYTGD